MKLAAGIGKLGNVLKSTLKATDNEVAYMSKNMTNLRKLYNEQLKKGDMPDAVSNLIGNVIENKKTGEKVFKLSGDKIGKFAEAIENGGVNYSKEEMGQFKSLLRSMRLEDTSTLSERNLMSRLEKAEGSKFYKPPKSNLAVVNETPNAGGPKATSGTTGTAEKTAEETTEKTASTSSENVEQKAEEAASSDNGSRKKSASGRTRNKLDEEVRQANAEEASNNKAWYEDEEAIAYADSRHAEQRAKLKTEWSNSRRNHSDRIAEAKTKLNNGEITTDEYNKMVHNSFETRRNDYLAMRQEREAINKDKVGVMDWVRGHDYDKAAVGIGALGFAGSVAFGGAKSNADLYSNPF